MYQLTQQMPATAGVGPGQNPQVQTPSEAPIQVGGSQRLELQPASFQLNTSKKLVWQQSSRDFIRHTGMGWGHPK